MKVSNKMVHQVRMCCHHGHGASIFADGTVMQAVSANEVVARRGAGQNDWEWRIAYVWDPKISRAELQEIFDDADRQREEYGE